MERIFKIKTTSDRDPRAQYPSERRYSASIVIGLSVIYLQLSLYSILMGSLIAHKMSVKNYIVDGELYNNTTNLENITKQGSFHLFEKVERDLHRGDPYYIRIPVLTCAGCFLMSVGFLSAFITGFFAWKHWYIDHNITFFFLANTFSMITSSLSLTISVMTFLYFHIDDLNTIILQAQLYPITLSFAINIFILSFIGVIWSILSSKLALRGMKTNYPDDMNFIGGRHIEINIVKKGNKNINIYPPDIISHFPSNDKLAKYLPKKDSSNLPKAESNTEYQQRVNMFLSGQNVINTNQI